MLEIDREGMLLCWRLIERGCCGAVCLGGDAGVRIAREGMLLCWRLIERGCCGAVCLGGDAVLKIAREGMQCWRLLVKGMLWCELLRSGVLC